MGYYKDLIIVIVIFIIIFAGIFKLESNYNNTKHSDDVEVTEWVSPDGVHYWYQRSGYHAMLAPRYDCDGNLVLDKKGNNNEVD